MFIAVILACLGDCVYFMDSSPDNNEPDCLVKLEEMTRVLVGLEFVVLERDCYPEPKVDATLMRFPTHQDF